MNDLRVFPSQVAVAASVVAGLLLTACGGGAGTSGNVEKTSATDKQAQAVPQIAVDQPAQALPPVPADRGASLAATLPAMARATDARASSTPNVHALAVVPTATPTAPSIPAAATGAVYYVDSQLGSDSNTGKAAVAGAAGVGPWRTLAKLTQTGFAPGDTIRLACGSVWNETLKLNSSGLSGQPITVAAASSNCAAPPVIDGSVVVPAANWTRYNGSIFRTALSKTAQATNNLITNGDFAIANVGWSVWSPKGDAVQKQVAACNNAACVNVTTGTDTSLLSSNSFALTAGANYTVQYSIKAAVGTKVRVLVRRAVAPFDAVGYNMVVTGNGTWQQLATTFAAGATLANARLDFEIPAPGVAVQVAAAGVVGAAIASSTTMDLLQLNAATGLLSPAHHPNQGYDAAQPTSVYLRNAADSDSVTANGALASTYLTTGADLKLPAGATIPNGTTVRIRTNAWTLDESKTNGYNGSRLSLVTPTSMPVAAGWGYYLMGQLWMLDSPGEWFYDKAAQTLYAWMPDGAAPSAPLLATFLAVGIESSGRQYVVYDGIAIRYVGTGVNMRNTIGVVVRNGTIQDTAGRGIDANGSQADTLESNVIARTAGDAIVANDFSATPSTGLRVAFNKISSSGVVMNGETTTTLPQRSYAAIQSGLQSTVLGNTIDNASYIGIWAMANSLVSENWVRGACTLLDDCGAIYTNGVNNNSTISSNVIEKSRGAIPGKPPTAAFTQAQGIYLDNSATGVTVTGNTVVDADNGIQIHIAANNKINGNKFYGNRTNQIWFHETTNAIRAAGDIFGNTVTGNEVVSTRPGTYDFSLVTKFSSTEAFAQFDGNHYFDRAYPLVGLEVTMASRTDYTFNQWKGAKTSAGVPRNQDANGRAASQLLYAPGLITGGNIVPNGNLAVNAKGWTTWNQTAPFGTLVRETCVPGTCARYNTGGSTSLLSSPNFSITKDQWYRVSFDLLAGADNQALGVIVRRGGGGNNGYEYLNAIPVTAIGNRTWKRVTFVFKSLKTINANDPVTADLGARVDFQADARQMVSVANLEIVPMTAMDAPGQSDILLNPGAVAAPMDCPVRATAPAQCDNYAKFTDDTPITWPLTVAPHSAEIIYTRNASLIDSDGDGIADSQDACPNTPSGAAVNSVGCSLPQP